MPTIKLSNHKKRDKTTNKVAQQNIYQDPRWRYLRAAKYTNNPLCEVCEANGRVTQTQEVHHIIPWETGLTPEQQEYLAFDYDNLLSVCSDCHHKIHLKLKK